MTNKELNTYKKVVQAAYKKEFKSIVALENIILTCNEGIDCLEFVVKNSNTFRYCIYNVDENIITFDNKQYEISGQNCRFEFDYEAKKESEYHGN